MDAKVKIKQEDLIEDSFEGLQTLHVKIEDKELLETSFNDPIKEEERVVTNDLHNTGSIGIITIKEEDIKEEDTKTNQSIGLFSSECFDVCEPSKPESIDLFSAEKTSKTFKIIDQIKEETFEANSDLPIQESMNRLLDGELIIKGMVQDTNVGTNHGLIGKEMAQINRPKHYIVTKKLAFPSQRKYHILPPEKRKYGIAKVKSKTVVYPSLKNCHNCGFLWSIHENARQCRRCGANKSNLPKEVHKFLKMRGTSSEQNISPEANAELMKLKQIKSHPNDTSCSADKIKSSSLLKSIDLSKLISKTAADLPLDFPHNSNSISSKNVLKKIVGQPPSGVPQISPVLSISNSCNAKSSPSLVHPNFCQIFLDESEMISEPSSMSLSEKLIKYNVLSNKTEITSLKDPLSLDYNPQNPEISLKSSGTSAEYSVLPQPNKNYKLIYQHDQNLQKVQMIRTSNKNILKLNHTQKTVQNALPVKTLRTYEPKIKGIKKYDQESSFMPVYIPVLKSTVPIKINENSREEREATTEHTKHLQSTDNLKLNSQVAESIKKNEKSTISSASSKATTNQIYLKSPKDAVLEPKDKQIKEGAKNLRNMQSGENNNSEISESFSKNVNDLGGENNVRNKKSSNVSEHGTFVKCNMDYKVKDNQQTKNCKFTEKLNTFKNTSDSININNMKSSTTHQIEKFGKNECYYCHFKSKDKKSLVKHILSECKNFSKSEIITCNECDKISLQSNQECKNCASKCEVKDCTFTTWFKKVMTLHKNGKEHSFKCKNCKIKINDVTEYKKHEITKFCLKKEPNLEWKPVKDFKLEESKGKMHSFVQNETKIVDTLHSHEQSIKLKNDSQASIILDGNNLSKQIFPEKLNTTKNRRTVISDKIDNDKLKQTFFKETNENSDHLNDIFISTKEKETINTPKSVILNKKKPVAIHNRKKWDFRHLDRVKGPWFKPVKPKPKVNLRKCVSCGFVSKWTKILIKCPMCSHYHHRRSKFLVQDEIKIISESNNEKLKDPNKAEAEDAKEIVESIKEEDKKMELPQKIEALSAVNEKDDDMGSDIEYINEIEYIFEDGSDDENSSSENSDAENSDAENNVYSERQEMMSEERSEPEIMNENLEKDFLKHSENDQNIEGILIKQEKKLDLSFTVTTNVRDNECQKCGLESDSRQVLIKCKSCSYVHKNRVWTNHRLNQNKKRFSKKPLSRCRSCGLKSGRINARCQICKFLNMDQHRENKIEKWYKKNQDILKGVNLTVNPNKHSNNQNINQIQNKQGKDPKIYVHEKSLLSEIEELTKEDCLEVEETIFKNSKEHVSEPETESETAKCTFNGEEGKPEDKKIANPEETKASSETTENVIEFYFENEDNKLEHKDNIDIDMLEHFLTDNVLGSGKVEESQCNVLKTENHKKCRNCGFLSRNVGIKLLKKCQICGYIHRDRILMQLKNDLTEFNLKDDKTDNINPLFSSPGFQLEPETVKHIGEAIDSVISKSVNNDFREELFEPDIFEMFETCGADNTQIEALKLRTCKKCGFHSKNERILRRCRMCLYTHLDRKKPSIRKMVEEKFDRYLSCYYCSFTTQCKKTLVSHILSVCTKVNKSEIIICFKCGVSNIGGKVDKKCENCPRICDKEGCNFATWFRPILKWHKEANMHYYQCEHCPFKTSFQNEYKNHMLIEKLTCPKCLWPAESEVSLETHMIENCFSKGKLETEYKKRVSEIVEGLKIRRKRANSKRTFSDQSTSSNLDHKIKNQSTLKPLDDNLVEEPATSDSSNEPEDFQQDMRNVLHELDEKCVMKMFLSEDGFLKPAYVMQPNDTNFQNEKFELKKVFIPIPNFVGNTNIDNSSTQEPVKKSMCSASNRSSISGTFKVVSNNSVAREICNDQTLDNQNFVKIFIEDLDTTMRVNVIKKVVNNILYVTYSCIKCGCENTNIITMKNHLNKEHIVGVKSNVIKCTFCSHTCLNVPDMNSHSTLHREKFASAPSGFSGYYTNKLRVQCLFCDYESDQVSIMRIHSKREHPESYKSSEDFIHFLHYKKLPLVFNCNLCDSFLQVVDDYRHLIVDHYTRKHSELFRYLSFSCRLCSCHTNSLSKIREHYKTKHNGAFISYQCLMDYCSFQTSDSNDFHIHQFVHHLSDFANPR